MHYRIKVLLTSSFGNPREITTICQTKSELKRRKTMYEERYPEADIFVEEIQNNDTPVDEEEPSDE